MVVCPGSLVSNWEKEFLKWLGQERLKPFAISADKTLEEFAVCRAHQVCSF